MNKNGEKEGKRSKGQKKDNNRVTKVNKAKGNDNKVPPEEKCGEADDISNKFPNFSLLNEQERQVFFQALTAARKNVESRGIPTRDRFGTVHDEYLKYFNQDDKIEEEEGGGAEEVTASVKTNSVILGDSVNPSCEWSIGQFHDQEPPGETKSRSPTLLMEGFSEATMESEIQEQCESLIQQDTDKVLGMYLDKKKRNEPKTEELQPENKKPDRKTSKLPRRETPEREKKQKEERKEKKKENALAYQVAETSGKTRETPRFDALNAEEKDMFFSILQEARNNIVQKNPERKGEILPLDSIVRRYKGERPATSVYTSSVQESRRRTDGKKNLRVKVTLTSGDNERMQRAKSEELSDRDKKERRDNEPRVEDFDHMYETEVEDPVEKDERQKPKEMLSNDSVHGKLQDSSLTVDVKSSPALKNVRNRGEKLPPMEAKPSEAKKASGKTKKLAKNQSYYMEGLKAVEETKKSTCQRGRRTANKPQKEIEEGKGKEKKKKRMLKDPLFEGTIEERPNDAGQLSERERVKGECVAEPGSVKEACMAEGERVIEGCMAEGEDVAAEKEDSDQSLTRSDCDEASCETFRIPNREEVREEGYNETCTMQVSSSVVPEEVPEEEEKREEEEKTETEVEDEEGWKECCFPGDTWGAQSKEKHSLTTVRSLLLGDRSGGEEEGEEEEEEKEAEVEEVAAEFPGMSTSAKVMIVDDNVIDKIRKLIYYLEAKAGKDDRLEKEYMKLLVDYVDYLSKVLEALVQKKERRKQVQNTYPAEVSLKFDESKQGEEGSAEGSKPLPRSVSAEDLATGSFLTFTKKKADAAEEKSTGKNESEGLSASIFPSDSDSSLQSLQETPYAPPALSNKKVVSTKIRLLQDLLKQRAEFVKDSADDLKILQHPQEEYVPVERPPIVKLITEEDEENTRKRRNFKFFRTLVKCFTCGKKKAEEEGIFENLKGEAVRVDVCEGTSKDPANATLNQSTMEVLKAAGRKRLIEKYYSRI